jgi:hypothetical protein
MALSTRLVSSSRSSRGTPLIISGSRIPRSQGRCPSPWRPHHPFLGDAAGQRIEVQRHDLVQFFMAGLGARQDQQLVDHVRGAVGAFRDQLQGVSHLRRLGFGKRDLGLGLEPGQRRAHLVRGLGDEALLRLQVFFQAPHHLVEGNHQRAHFFRHAGYRYRRQVGRTARWMRSCSRRKGAMPRIRPM